MTKPLFLSDRPRQPAVDRIGALATLPVFFRMSDRHALLAGGGDGAVWKAELLLAAGAVVRCFAAVPSLAMRALAEGSDRLLLEERGWKSEDFTDVIVAICDTDDEDDAVRFRDVGRQRGVPVNIVDRPSLCDFQFGSIVNRSPLVVAISTDGAAPVFGQALRARIEALLPATFAAWAQAAKDWRTRLKALELPFRARRAFWEAFTARALREPDQEPTAALYDTLLAGQSAARGKVLLVGAGPGDPELLTLRAVRALQTADVVLYDDLVSPQVLGYARREAKRVNVGKRGYKPSCGQDEISAMLVAFGQAGNVVARLKGGDPLIFGRANEEIAALQAAGVDVEIVPGVTAASGAAASLATSLTERDVARRLQFVTAHARDGQLPGDLDWQALADPRATTAVYMGVRTLPALVEKLQVHGLPGSTPVIMVERATWADERVVASTLATIVADTMAITGGPSLFLIGAALSGVHRPERGAVPVISTDAAGLS